MSLLSRLALPFTLCMTVLALGAPVARADWTTYHADGSLSGVDPSSGSAVPFAPAWTAPNLSGTVWAEPLVYQGLVYVATENNDIYAFNESNGAVAWHVNAGAPVPSSEVPCGDISPTVGITSTPVIDPASGVLYAVADLRAGSSASHTLLAYNARTGAPVFSRSVEPPSDPLNQLQRESLALDGGRVLVGFGGNDGDCAQYKGFLVSAHRRTTAAATTSLRCRPPARGRSGQAEDLRRWTPPATSTFPPATPPTARTSPSTTVTPWRS